MKICPNNPEHIMFVTTAVVSQLWVVGVDGEKIEVIDDCFDVVQEPQRESVWQCLECGAVAEEYRLRLIKSDTTEEK